MPTDTDLDAVDLLRALRPGIDAAFDPDSPTARAQLERILDAPMPTPAARHRRAPTRRIAIATAATAALAAGAVAVSPFAGGSPDVVAKAAAALTEPNTILHYKTQLLGAESDRLGTTEGWETSDGQRKRMLVGDVEIAEDDDARSYLTYDAEHNVIRRLTDPDFFNAPSRGVDATSPFWDPSDIGDLAQLLQRARGGDDKVDLVGEATVRGIATYEVRIDYTIQVLARRPKPGEDPTTLPTQPLKLTRIGYVDKDTFLPVRVVEQWPGRPDVVVDYVEIERLPATPDNERLVQMPPHPGAKEIVVGKV